MKYSNELLREIPVFRRARGYRLYDQTGRRFLDMYQDSGRAILGHRPAGVSLVLKSVIAKGTMAGYPSVYEDRLKKALSSLVPGYNGFRIYSSREAAMEAAQGYFESRTELYDPLFGDSISGFSLWRPFIDMSGTEAGVLMPVIPFPGNPVPAVLLFREDPEPDFYPSDLISPVVLAGMVRGVYDLIEAVKEWDGNRWNVFESSIWERKGPYLIYRKDTLGYKELFREFLENDIIISPDPFCPSIAPGEWNAGEISFLKKFQ